MREIIIALLSSSITIVITSFFNYHFLVRKEVRMQANSYKVEILQSLYTPLMTEVNKAHHPLNGYKGFEYDIFENVDEIIRNNYQLVSPDLSLIHKILVEENFLISVHSFKGLFDEDQYLLNHLEYNFNFYRKELGLPFNKVEMNRALKGARITNGQLKKKEHSYDS